MFLTMDTNKMLELKPQKSGDKKGTNRDSKCLIAGGHGDSSADGSYSSTLQFELTEIPPVPVSIFLALQHVLLCLTSALTISSVISDLVCAHPGHPIRARLFCTTLFMAGLCSVGQTLLGVRLPVFQGPSSSFLVPLITLGRDPSWMCQDDVTLTNHPGSGNVTGNATDYVPILSLDEKLQQLSGSLMAASMLEVIVGGAGLMKPMLRLVGPLAVAPTISLIGLSLFKLPAVYGQYNPAIAISSAILVIIFALYLPKIQLPLPTFQKNRKMIYLPIFQLLPILFALTVMWILSSIFTAAGLFPDNPNNPLYYSRTDAKYEIVSQTGWFQYSYPGQFGLPSFSTAAFIGFLAAVMSSVVESIGDYFATAKACQVHQPPDHAISRGILIEGLGSVLSGALGAAHATTSYSGNIAMLSLTKTASRSVLNLAGVMLIFLSFIGKMGAAVATLPTPILGGLLLIVAGMLVTLGLSTLKHTDLSSNRNMLILGVAFMSGLSVPFYVESYRESISTGIIAADQCIQVILGTPMFLGGIIAIFLDNTVPGTDEERGLIQWRLSHSNAGQSTKEHDRIVRMPTANQNLAKGDVLKKKQKDLSEDSIYGFRCLKGRLPRVFRFIPFLPPSSFRRPKKLRDEGRV